MAYAGLLLLGLGLAGALALGARAAWYSERSFHPPRVLPQRSGLLAAARDVALRTRDGLTLRGGYLPSRSGAAVLLVHGLGQARDGLRFEAEALAQAGHGVLLFDLRGHGESEGGEATWGDRERLDVHAALDFLRAQPEVDRARIGAVGFSMGAYALAEVAAEDAGVAALVLLSPSPSLREGLACDYGRYGALSRTGALLPFWRRGIDVDALHTERALGRIHPRPVLLVVGGEEPCREMTEAFFARVGPPAQTWLLEGAGHGTFAAVAPGPYAARLRAFFDEALGRGAAAAATAPRP